MALPPRIIIVHGIHTNDSVGWMDFLVERFRDCGWNAAKWTYGYAYAMLTRWQNPGRAKALAALIQPGDVVLGHSNGCCLAWMAAELGAPIGGAIMLNPALDCDKVMARQVPWVNLYANRHDEVVPLAKVFVGHPWGAQGRDGLGVKDDRYQTVFTDGGYPVVRGHSDILSPEKLPLWSTRIIQDADARRGAVPLKAAA